MTEPAKDFWARADRDLLDRWPKDEAGAPEPAAKLDIQWEPQTAEARHLRRREPVLRQFAPWRAYYSPGSDGPG